MEKAMSIKRKKQAETGFRKQCGFL